MAEEAILTQTEEAKAVETYTPPSTQELFKNETPSSVKKEETKSSSPAVTEKAEEVSRKDDKKAESKKAEAEPPKSPEINWDNVDNPYKKRYEDTQKWGNETNKKVSTYEKQLRKLKDTYGYTDEDIAIPEEPPEGMTPEQQSDLEGRIKASGSIAKELHGEEYIQQNIYNQESVWQKELRHNPVLFFRAQNAEAPVLEIIKILKEYEFYKEYGNTPDKIKESITKKVESELKEKISKEFQEKLKQKNTTVDTLTGIKSQESKKTDGSKEPTTKQLFG